MGARERKGKERKGRERKGKEGKGRERKGKEGKGRERKGKEERMGKEGKGRERKAERKADRKGKEGGKGMSGKEAAGDQRVWLRGRLWTAWLQGWLEMVGEKKPLEISELGCADGCGRRGCKGGWKWLGRRSRWRSASLAARTAADRKWVRRTVRTAADGVGATEWLEMGGEKKPLVMSELGCADGCGRQMGRENCGARDWGEEAAGDQRAWLRGRLRMGNGFGELRGRLRTVGRRSRWRSASVAARTAADGKWVRRMARTAADGAGAREWLEMVREKKPLGMSELGCADGCERQMGGENCADGCRRHGCKGVAAPEAAGDERAWLRGRLRAGNGCGELRGRLRTAWVQGSGWKWVGRRTRCSPRTRMLTRMLMDMQSLRTSQNNFLQ